MHFDIQPIGDDAIMISFGNQIDLSIHQQVKKLSSHLSEYNYDWMKAYIPAYTNVTIRYNPIEIMKSTKNTAPYEYVCGKVSTVMQQLENEPAGTANIIEIPVCYGGTHGPDIAYVAKKNHLSEEDVITLHCKGEYLVYMIGFAPGFPYIGGMSKKISTPRKETPRMKIPAGSVGIAGQQTGLYPISSPGGWQIIGQTPVKLFRPNADQPTLFNVGDKIRFKPVDEKTFQEWEDSF